MPCPLADMPKFPSSHEMSMKRARHEQRMGGAARGGPQPGPRGQQVSHYPPQGVPPAQRQRTQGQYGGPPAPYAQQQQQQQYRGGAGGAQQPYRGGGPGMGGAPAAAAAAGMRLPGPIIGTGPLLTSEQVQQMMAQGVMVPGMAGQAGAGGYGYASQPARPGGPGPSSHLAHGAGMQPHRYGGGAQPSWNTQRR
jgi:hypothetical protein